MKFAVAVFVCALAVANAQFNRGAYNNFGQYQQGQYNRYQPFNKYNNQAYRPYVTSTPFPIRPAVAKATASVTVTPPPAAPVVSVVPVAPVVPAVPSVPVLSVAKVAADARSAETIRSAYDISPDGTYNYFYETNNGIAAQAQGTPRNFGGNPPVVPDVAQGSFSWISPEGKTIAVTYVADENGYQPQSDALPVPPPLPPQIARALEYIARTNKN